MKQQSQGKASSGVINATQLPPLSGSQRQHPEGIQEELEDQMMDDMEMDEQMENQPYGMEMEEDAMEDEEEDQGITFEGLRDIIEKTEDEGKDQVFQAREANYISKGTYIWQLLSQIETGEQAISFFAKHGHNTPIKFINCKRKPVPADQFRPYDLVKIEDEKALENEYFTVSAQGVVHVSQDKGKRNKNADAVPTEFLSLSEWM